MDIQDERIVPHGYPTDWNHYYEGFWARTEEESDDTGLPWPVSQSRPHPRIGEFLEKLKRVENNAEITRIYKNEAPHTCKICNQRIATTKVFEYWMQHPKTGKIWMWPYQTLHYYSEHQVWPTQAFVNAILNAIL